MVERTRLRLLGSMACLAVAPAPARADADDAVLSVMAQVLEGRIDAALATAQALAQRGGHTLAEPLLRELGDMARGDYATTGNRSFAALAPLWRQARRRRLAAIPVPAGALPDQALSLASNVRSLMVADLTRHAGWLLQRSDQGGWTSEAYYLSSGVNGPGKRRRGDRRTPTGVYWITDEIDTRRLPARYGSRALALDYPNAWDRKRGRSGDGIWIHGIDPANNVRPPRDTDGCLAISEDRIASLADRIEPGVTPILVCDEVRWRTNVGARDDLVASLDDDLAAWCRARAGGDPDAWLAHYDPRFSDHGMPAAQWRSWRRAVMRAGAIAAVAADAVSHFRLSQDVYLTRFRQTLHRSAEAAAVTTWQRLYRQRIDAPDGQKNGRWRIVAQSAG